MLEELKGLSLHSLSLAIDCCNTCNFSFLKKKKINTPLADTFRGLSNAGHWGQGQGSGGTPPLGHKELMAAGDVECVILADLGQELLPAIKKEP